MKKQDFIKAVAADAGLSQDAVSKALTSMIDVITGELKLVMKLILLDSVHLKFHLELLEMVLIQEQENQLKFLL